MGVRALDSEPVALMSFNNSSLALLNAPQREAVMQIHGPLLILAGAGTGKTRVVTTRIAYMVDQGIPPDKILAVTFTNKAANEMRERVEQTVRKGAGELVTVSTFHSLCVKILRMSIDCIGYKKNFSIYTGGDQTGLVRKLIVEMGGKDEKVEPNEVLAAIGNFKNRGIALDDAGDDFIAGVARAYQRELKKLNAVDFDDLLILAVQVLSEHAHVREHWRARFHYIMVDEFQDTNSQQMALLKNLVSADNNVCVVGDDDQSIYGWRGAEITNILEFERFFPNPKVVKLEENYRSTNPILHTANSLIKHNQNRREKKLWSQKDGSDKVRLIGMPNDTDEAQTVVEEIFEIQSTEKRNWNDFAILIRMNAQTRIFEQMMRDAKIPYRVIGGMSFFDRREIKDLLGYLYVVLNPDDDVNLLRIINSPPRGIGGNTITLLNEYSREMGISVYQALCDEDFTRQLSKRGQTAIIDFIEFIDNCRDEMLGTDIDYPARFEKMIVELEYIEFVRRGCKTEKEATSREKNVAELVESLHYHRSKARNHKKRTLQGFLDNAALKADREEEDDFDKQQGVSLITLHASKGLEYPIVYLVGLEEGTLPHSRSIEQGTTDEERRLLYVGITRAMERLTITYCITRKRYGDLLPVQPSSFLKQLDRTFVEEFTFEEVTKAPADEELAHNYFARMREMLASGE
jgi:DNA helicase-2/ATP-dependent DNA helicase PcrA